MKDLTQKDLWFIEWEQEVFGFGYGTGEEHTLKSIKKFFEYLNDNSYSYEILEEKLGQEVTWLLINIFGHNNIIEYGTSARFGWLTSNGEMVRDYFKDKSINELYKILMSDIETVCKCNGEIKEHKECGKNPFLNEKLADNIKYSK